MQKLADTSEKSQLSNQNIDSNSRASTSETKTSKPHADSKNVSSPNSVKSSSQTKNAKESSDNLNLADSELASIENPASPTKIQESVQNTSVSSSVGENLTEAELESPAESTPKPTSLRFGSIFDVAASWSQKVQINSNISKFTLDLAQGYKQDFKDLKEVLNSSAKIASEGISKGIQSIKLNSQEDSTTLDKNDSTASNASDSLDTKQLIEYDERGIPIVELTANSNTGQDNLPDSSKNTNSSEDSTAQKDQTSTAQIVVDSSSLQDLLAESTKDIGDFFKGFGSQSNYKTFETTKFKFSSFVKNLGSEIEILAKNAVTISNPDVINSEHINNKVSDSLVEKQRNNLLLDLQSNKYTFTIDPSKIDEEKPENPSDKRVYPLALQSKEVSQQFIAFKEAFNLAQFQSKYKLLLETNQVTHDLFNELVPSELTEDDFWCRYYFRECQFDSEHERRLKLLREAVSKTHEDDFDWEMEDEDFDVLDQSSTKDISIDSNAIIRENAIIDSQNTEKDTLSTKDNTIATQDDKKSTKISGLELNGSAGSDNDWDTWE
ncbi:hypothetical protein BB561_004786 [Smittium simulii]|uniref:BSD domain-containing protein n=1 Tax=Smittium simulii TaxID=133385 RepID=A0A2T9YE99_9FUNG|nr:hypothetical protein BB561_004786 [Smittium simulii]